MFSGLCRLCMWMETITVNTIYSTYSCFGMDDSSLTENVCTGNIWVVDNTYFWLIIGTRHYWHSSVITHCIFGILPRKSNINEPQECSNGWTFNHILTMRQLKLWRCKVVEYWYLMLKVVCALHWNSWYNAHQSYFNYYLSQDCSIVLVKDVMMQDHCSGGRKRFTLMLLFNHAYLI